MEADSSTAETDRLSELESIIAHEEDNYEAMCELGVILIRGIDPKRGFKLIKKSARGNYPEAMGRMYLLVGENCCAECGLDGRVAKLMKCQKCKRNKYCSRQCQKANWKEHKFTCLPQEIAMIPAPLAVPGETAEIYGKARDLKSQAKYEEAEMLYRQLTLMDPYEPFHFFELGECIGKNPERDVDVAISYMDRAIKMSEHPRYTMNEMRKMAMSDCRSSLALVYLSLGKEKEALDLVRFDEDFKHCKTGAEILTAVCGGGEEDEDDEEPVQNPWDRVAERRRLLAAGAVVDATGACSSGAN